jgi:hypothetical protein
MDLSEIIGNAIDQERGRVMEIVDPWSGKPLGIRMTIVGPDSETQRKSRIALMDELSEMAGHDGRVTAENRETARINSLARCVIGWDVSEGGNPLSFSHSNVVRVLRASRWLQEQVDAFAGDRSAFKPGTM